MANVLLVAPSKEFLEKLPYRKIPDKRDFWRFKGRDRERVIYWQTVLGQGRFLGEAFHDAVDSGRIRKWVQPLHGLR
jgi:hypothetical protein